MESLILSSVLTVLNQHLVKKESKLTESKGLKKGPGEGW